MLSAQQVRIALQDFSHLTKWYDIVTEKKVGLQVAKLVIPLSFSDGEPTDIQFATMPGHSGSSWQHAEGRCGPSSSLNVHRQSHSFQHREWTKSFRH